MNIETLKKLGKAESDLAKMRMLAQKKYLMDFSDDPEVAKVIDYMTRYQEEIPDNHPIYKHINEIKNTKDNKKLAKSLIKDKTDAEEKRSEEEEKEREEKREKIKLEMNEMLKKLEQETDKIFDFLSKNQKHLSGDMVKIGSILKTRRFLISVKNGFKYATMK